MRAGCGFADYLSSWLHRSPTVTPWCPMLQVADFTRPVATTQSSFLHFMTILSCHLNEQGVYSWRTEEHQDHCSRAQWISLHSNYVSSYIPLLYSHCTHSTNIGQTLLHESQQSTGPHHFLAATSYGKSIKTKDAMHTTMLTWNAMQRSCHLFESGPTKYQCWRPKVSK